MKTIIILLLPVLLYSFHQQSSIKAADLNNMKGNWRGTLNYLDYTSNKPVTIPSNFYMTTIAGNSNAFLVQFYYTDEPQANKSDTLLITDGGKKLDDYTVLKNQEANGTRIIVVTKQGIDGNDNKKATIRKTHTITKQTLSIQKEVLFEDTDNWIIRHTYHFTKSK